MIRKTFLINYNMACIFCGSKNINEECAISGKKFILCGDCRGKYSVHNEKKQIINYPKRNISPVICAAAILPLIPLGIIIRNISTEGNAFSTEIFQIFLIIYANFAALTITTGFFQCVYNSAVNGYMIFMGRVITNNDPSWYKNSRFIGCIIGGIVMLTIIFFMDIVFIRYFFRI